MGNPGACLPGRPDYHPCVKEISIPLACAVLAAVLPWAATTAEEPAGQDTEALKRRVAELEKQVGELRDAQEPAKLVEQNKQAARARAAKDRETYSAEQLREIEQLYQVANRNWRSPEAVASLEQLIGKFDKANRTGCAVLYLGQMSEGEQRLKYLRRAIEQFSDCYYFDGCQVGGYARLVLADTLAGLGQKDEAAKLLADVRKDYQNATDHRGRRLIDVIPKE